MGYENSIILGRINNYVLYFLYKIQLLLSIIIYLYLGEVETLSYNNNIDFTILSY